MNSVRQIWIPGDRSITAEILTGEIGGPDPNQRLAVGGFQVAVEHAEKQLLQEALRNSDGSKTAAAAAPGMKPSTFRAKHGLA